MTPTPPKNQIDSGGNLPSNTPIAETPPLAKPKKEKKEKAKKGVETLFRTMMSNHIKLSEMADRKANLMISINTIIVSITISAYARQFDTPATLLIPSLLLLMVCLITIVVSLIATNPTTTSPVKRAAVSDDDRPVDLLFFGSYTRLTADQYRRQLRKLLKNDDDLYTSLIDNLYAQGLVLSRKYRLLKFAYQFFMIGFSVVVLIVAISLIAAYWLR